MLALIFGIFYLLTSAFQLAISIKIYRILCQGGGMVDSTDLKSVGPSRGHAGSSPVPGTMTKLEDLWP